MSSIGKFIKSRMECFENFQSQNLSPDMFMSTSASNFSHPEISEIYFRQPNTPGLIEQMLMQMKPKHLWLEVVNTNLITQRQNLDEPAYIS